MNELLTQHVQVVIVLKSIECTNVLKRISFTEQLSKVDLFEDSLNYVFRQVSNNPKVVFFIRVNVFVDENFQMLLL